MPMPSSDPALSSFCMALGVGLALTPWGCGCRHVRPATALVLPFPEVLLAGQRARGDLGVDLAVVTHHPPQHHGGGSGLCHGEPEAG